MLRCLSVYLLFFTLIMPAAAQELESIQHFQYLNRTSPNKIGFGCGFAGEMSPNISAFAMLVQNGDFDLVKKLLYAEVPASRFFAVMVCEHYAGKKLVLSPGDRKQIGRIKRSTDRVEICSGCTFHEKRSLHAILSSNDNQVPKGNVIYWLEELDKAIKAKDE